MTNESCDTHKPSKTPAKPKAPAKAPAKPIVPSKTDMVLALLMRPGGAALEDLVKATGWLPHTARAALTGLKKKGHTITRAKVDGLSRYSIAATASK